MILDSSAPMTTRMRRVLEQERGRSVDDWAKQLRQRYDRNLAAGRLIDDDGDEHGCPTKGPYARCRMVQEAFTLNPDELL